jgi:maleate isomerase
VSYGRGGTIALLTPSGNPTAEPEISVQLLPDVSLLTARMVSTASSIAERLRDYGDGLGKWVEEFKGIAVDAVIFACTGTSYLRNQSDPLPRVLSGSLGKIPLITPAEALKSGLAALRVGTISIISPYPEDLTERARLHWIREGLGIAEIHRIVTNRPGHPIYSTSISDIVEVIEKAQRTECGAIVILGTGAPSLAAIASVGSDTRSPILSSNLCTGWAVANLLDGGSTPIEKWISPEAPWRKELGRRFPSLLELNGDAE